MSLSKAEHDYIEEQLAKGIECHYGNISSNNPDDKRIPCHKRGEEFMMFDRRTNGVVAYCREHYEGLIKVLNAMGKLSGGK